MPGMGAMGMGAMGMPGMGGMGGMGMVSSNCYRKRLRRGAGLNFTPC